MKEQSFQFVWYHIGYKDIKKTKSLILFNPEIYNKYIDFILIL